MSFDKHGFFSPAIEGFRATIREIAPYKPWFEFAEHLNRLGLDMLQDHEVPRDDNQRVTVTERTRTSTRFIDIWSLTRRGS